MKITNKYGLPQTIINAMERDDYSMGEARMSVTGLLKPPRIGLLYKKHHQEIEKDVSDMIWSLFGRAVHKVLELGGDEEHIPEERLFTEIRGWVISGGVDLQKLGGNRVRIVDYKVTSAYAVMSEKAEWDEQLNSYAYLIREARGLAVDGLSICALIRDWNRHKARDNPDYPQAPTQMLDIPLWSHEEARKFLTERVRIHQAAITSSDMGDEPPLCTDDERWMRMASYAVHRGDNKRASRVFDNREDAQAYADTRESLGAGREPPFRVVERKGEPIRCTGDYCHVSGWCSQYAKWKEEQNG